MITQVLNTFHMTRSNAGLVRQAAGNITPKKVAHMIRIQKMILDEFMD